MKIKFSKQNFLRTSGFLRIPWLLGKYFLGTILILFGISLLLIGILFYVYDMKSKQKIVIEQPSIIFREDIYGKILGKLEKDADKIEEIKNKNYNNPFSEKQ